MDMLFILMHLNSLTYHRQKEKKKYDIQKQRLHISLFFSSPVQLQLYFQRKKIPVVFKFKFLWYFSIYIILWYKHMNFQRIFPLQFEPF